MSDPIKALIEAAEAALAWMDLRDYEEERDLYPRRNLRYAIAAAKAAGEDRPDPNPRGANNLREPLPGRAEIAIRVGANTMSGSCLIADIGKDVAELAGIMMRRHGEARPEPKPDPDAGRQWIHKLQVQLRTAKSLSEAMDAIGPCPEPAAEPSDKVAIYLQAAADCRMNKTTDDWQELTMMYLSNAVEALAREVRRVR